MAEHTKGKWEVSKQSSEGHTYEYWVLVEEPLKRIAVIENTGTEDEANARLIAAAPATAAHRDKLLAAMEEIGKVILKLSDNADSERMNVQERGNYDFGYAEGKSVGLQTAETQIGKIINEAKSAIAGE